MNDDDHQLSGSSDISFEETHPHLREFSTFLPELNKESDRGIALIATSYVDELLGRTIEAFLIEGQEGRKLTRGFNAPLGGLSTRITAAAAMGLISDREANEANTMRKIRNRFAHKVHVSFEHQDIIDLCNNLTHAIHEIQGVKVTARFQFVSSASSFILHLVNRPHYVGLKRLKERTWPY